MIELMLWSVWMAVAITSWINNARSTKRLWIKIIAWALAIGTFLCMERDVLIGNWFTR